MHSLFNIEGKKAILVKPQTYMNLSGNCVQQFADFYKRRKMLYICIKDS